MVGRPKTVHRLTTSSGYTIEATANHPVLVEDRWVELGSVRPGDLVGVAARTKTDGGSKVTDAEIDLAALLISEGYTPDVRNGPMRNAHFCNTDPELLASFRAAFQTYFGYPHERATTHAGVTRLRLLRKELLALEPVIGRFGLAAEKVIPARVVNAPLRKVERFLGLYFCADGWADRSGVHFGSKSRDVCVALKRMLLRCGIVSNLQLPDVDPSRHPLHVVDGGQRAGQGVRRSRRSPPDGGQAGEGRPMADGVERRRQRHQDRHPCQLPGRGARASYAGHRSLEAGPRRGHRRVHQGSGAPPAHTRRAALLRTAGGPPHRRSRVGHRGCRRGGRREGVLRLPHGRSRPALRPRRGLPRPQLREEGPGAHQEGAREVRGRV